jgi:hypothetical protein
MGVGGESFQHENISILPAAKDSMSGFHPENIDIDEAGPPQPFELLKESGRFINGIEIAKHIPISPMEIFKSA